MHWDRISTGYDVYYRQEGEKNWVESAWIDLTELMKMFLNWFTVIVAPAGKLNKNAFIYLKWTDIIMCKNISKQNCSKRVWPLGILLRELLTVKALGRDEAGINTKRHSLE
jgi:hypothetical protein